MCGLAGIVQANSSQNELTHMATAMADAVAHRGPDSSGVWASPTLPIALSHRRLSIIDLSPSGHQPMCSSRTKSTMVYNGEVYNFKLLRQDLEKKGFVFNGHSDTEIVLATIDAYGFDAMLEKIKGMYAIAHWNEDEQILRLARDRIGEKPLYYGHTGNSLIFASELKSIYQVLPAKTLTLDQQALNSFLRYGYISAPLTIFKEIKKLPPGHKAEVAVGQWINNERPIEDIITVEPYWCVEDYASKTPHYADTNTQEALGDLDTLVNRVIQEQAQADVPLGAFLSGGIDSSLVSAVLQAQSAKPIETFTIGFHEKTFNEAEHAKKIAEHIGSHHNELYLSSKDALDLIPSIPDIYDEPFADASQLPTFLVSQFAKSKVSVCLSGDGGDELFAGYNRYIQGQTFHRLAQKIPAPLKSLTAITSKQFSSASIDRIYQKFNSLLRRNTAANFGVKVQKAVEALSFTDAYALYQYLCSYHQLPSQLQKSYTQNTTLSAPAPFGNDFIAAGMAWDQQWYLPGDNLVKSDRASMAVSLEMRVPLLDKELIEFAWSLPTSMKYKDGKSKWLLREMLYRYVPKKLIERPKMGFSIPISDWINSDLKQWSNDLLSKSTINNQAIFEYGPISELLLEHSSGKVDNGNRLWTLLMFQSWYNKYVVN